MAASAPQRRKQTAQLLEVLIAEHFADPGAFYERLAVVEEREIKAGRRAPRRGHTNARDAWRSVVRQVLRGERGIGWKVGPIFAKAFNMPLGRFAHAIGMTEEEILSPPRIARRDFEHDLALVTERVSVIEKRLDGLGMLLREPTMQPFVQGIGVDREAMREFARALLEEMQPNPMNRQGRRKAS